MFVRKRGHSLLILGIYVDDGAVAASSEDDINELMQHLEKNFEMTTQTDGQLLGMEIKVQESGTIVISQRSYAGRVVSRFRMTNSFPVSTPIDLNRTNVCSANFRKQEFPYREAVGCLNFLAVVTRPDIAYAVGVAGRHLDNHGPAEVKMVKRILSYLNKTVDYGLVFGEGSLDLEGYCDARTMRETKQQGDPRLALFFWWQDVQSDGTQEDSVPWRNRLRRLNI